MMDHIGRLSPPPPPPPPPSPVDRHDVDNDRLQRLHNEVVNLLDRMYLNEVRPMRHDNVVALEYQQLPHDILQGVREVDFFHTKPHLRGG